MAINYRTENYIMYGVYKWDYSDNSYTRLGGGGDTYDIFADDVETDDGILFQQSNANGGKFWKLEIDIDEEVIADSIDGIWEARYIDGSIYGNVWTSINVIEDTINNFSQTGTKHLIFEPPVKWDNRGPVAGDTGYYAFSIRYRLTSLDNITQYGSISSAKTHPDRILVDNDTDVLTMEDLYQYSEDNNLGVIQKLGETTYTLDCSLRCYSGVEFISKSESITFLHNYMPYMACKCTLGELTASGKPINGTTFRFKQKIY